MPLLLAVSILAFVALFWAAISILGAVRRARRRRRRANANSVAAAVTAPQNSSPREILYVDPEAAVPPVAPPPRVESPPPPPGLRTFPTRLGKHTLASSGSDDSWAKWNPFGTDYADLTDPAPSRRFPRVHGRNKERSR